MPQKSPLWTEIRGHGAIIFRILPPHWRALDIILCGIRYSRRRSILLILSPSVVYVKLQNINRNIDQAYRHKFHFSPLHLSFRKIEFKFQNILKTEYQKPTLACPNYMLICANTVICPYL